MGTTLDCFSRDYAQTRERFMEVTSKARALTDRVLHALKGPNGEELSTDAAWFGPKSARNSTRR
ncbi:DUF2817 domain-containing protein [Paraburkholderia caribensis]|uniref:DUF2817 domain-containing protein n=1 Tax=Paraburkholderia TaxID=1822464 RepID=UPI001CC368B6